MPSFRFVVRSLWAPVLGLSIALGSLSDGVRGDDPPAPTKLEMAEGKLIMMAPGEWKKVEPKSSMIQYEFMAPKDAKEEEQARITIMPAGGSIDANIERWKGQFDLANEKDAEVEKKEVGNCVLHMVDLKGTYKESMGGPLAGGQVKKRENWRMLGLIVETKDSGLYFIKMTGSKDTVEKLNEGWKKMIEGMEQK